MKFINSVVMLMIFCGSKLSLGEKLDCDFTGIGFQLVGYVYTCIVTSLDNTLNNITIDGYSGIHEEDKNDADVKVIYIYDTNTKYIPANLGSLFRLSGFHMRVNELIEIRSTDFQGMQELKFLALTNNNLRFIPSDAFASLTKLVEIDLRRNQIEEIPKGVFSNNLNLKLIVLIHNKIKFLGSGLFNELPNLWTVNLNDNICVSKYFEGEQIIQIEKEIILNCQKPNEIPATTTTTTTQTPLKSEVMELKNQTIVN